MCIADSYPSTGWDRFLEAKQQSADRDNWRYQEPLIIETDV